MRDRAALRDCCRLVALRAARLSAAAVAAVLGRAPPAPGAPPAVVAIDGGVFEHNANFRQRMREAIAEVLGPKAAAGVELRLTPDGSGIGAALLAATHAGAA